MPHGLASPFGKAGKVQTFVGELPNEKGEEGASYEITHELMQQAREHIADTLPPASLLVKLTRLHYRLQAY